MSDKDLDARQWSLKHEVAAAETAGDADGARRLHAELEAVEKQIREIHGREVAAARRRETAAEDQTVAQKSAPVGRRAPRSEKAGE